MGLWNATAAAFDTYYFDTGAGHWIKMGDPAMADCTDLAIPPGAAIALTRPAGRPAARILLTGLPASVAPLIKLAGGSVMTYAGMGAGVDQPLAPLNLGPNWRRADSAAKADDLSLSSDGQGKWKRFYQRKDGVWVKLSGSAAAKTVIPAGGVVGFVKHKNVSGAASFISAGLPYAP